VTGREVERLLRLYPSRWRERYGAELTELIAESSAHERMSWHDKTDLVAGAVRERLRAAGVTHDGAPHQRATGGIVLALGAWWLFVVGAMATMKFSEHWPSAVPSRHRAAPAGAYHVMLAAVAAASLMVIVGVGVASGKFLAFLRSGGWPAIRKPVLAAAGLTASAAFGLAGLVAWAGTRDAAQRNGHDVGYQTVFVVVATMCIAALFAWTISGIAATRRLGLSDSVLRIEAWLLFGLALAMTTAISASAAWWLDRALTWQPPAAAAPDRAASSPFGLLPITGGITMLVATVIAVFAAGHAVRAVGEST
jgi:hypothetical protein